MNYCIFTFRSVTFAQRAKRILASAGIRSTLMRTPAVLTRRGCGYSLKLRQENGKMAAELFSRHQMEYEGQYVLFQDGTYREWAP